MQMCLIKTNKFASFQAQQQQAEQQPDFNNLSHHLGAVAQEVGLTPTINLQTQFNAMQTAQTAMQNQFNAMQTAQTAMQNQLNAMQTAIQTTFDRFNTRLDRIDTTLQAL